MERARAFAPGHITGFFFICDEHDDPLRAGSQGAGFSIEKGVTTEARLLAGGASSGGHPEIRVTINGRVRSDAAVSTEAAHLVVAEATAKGNDPGPTRLELDEWIEVPEGCGFGTSGAGALSVAYAVNELLGRPLSRDECGQAAHRAEITCGTGLGSVIAEAAGGFEVRRAPGAPGIGTIEGFGQDEDRDALFLVLGPLATRSMLSDENTRRRINDAGRSLFAEFVRNPSLAEFLRESRRFAEATGLISERLRRTMQLLDEAGIPCSMPMFGEGLFMLLTPRESVSTYDLLERSGEKDHLLLSKVDPRGGRVIDVA